jgi:lysophospholipase L1-like esterase
VTTNLFYPTTITKALTGTEYSVPEVRENQYFQNKLFHPNEQGHKKIAEILLEFYERNNSN